MEPQETEIQRSICDYLALRKHFFWRNNNTPIYDPTRKVFRAMPKYTMRGIPDIIVIANGHFYGIEVKRHGAALSKHQMKFAELCKKHNGTYFIARNIGDVQMQGL